MGKRGMSKKKKKKKKKVGENEVEKIQNVVKSEKYKIVFKKKKKKKKKKFGEK